MSKSFDQLVAQLLEDRAMIIAGDIMGLAASSSGHSETLEYLERGKQVSIDKLLQLKNLAASNARLLKAAIKGMHDARVSVLPKPRKATGLSTYSNSGSCQSLTPQIKSVEKRA